MKKLLLSVIVILILVLVGITVIRGFQLGGIKILGIAKIKTKNEELDDVINQATKLASVDYQRKLDDLNSAIKKLESEKTNYEDMVNVSTDSEVEAANQTYDYKIDFLWIRIENHAKTEGVNMKMELTRSSSGAQNVYNLNFTATGPYIGIEEFITHIEDDSKLGFKIEDFKMTTGSEEDSNIVQASFTCKDIKIEGISTNTINSIDSTAIDDENKNENTNKTIENNKTTKENSTE